MPLDLSKVLLVGNTYCILLSRRLRFFHSLNGGCAWLGQQFHEGHFRLILVNDAHVVQRHYLPSRLVKQHAVGAIRNLVAQWSIQ